MTENDDIPDFSTRPNPHEIVKDDGPHSVLIRLHQRDWNVIKTLLKRDGLSFQKFVSLCSGAYLDGDMNIVKCIRTYRTIDKIPLNQVSKGVFSNRERADIYAELERAEKEGK